MKIVLCGGRTPASRGRAPSSIPSAAQEQSDLEWLVNVVPYFRDLRGRPFVVADYDLVLSDPEPQLRRMASGLALPLTAQTEAAIQAYAGGFLRPGMRHSVLADRDLDGRVNPLTAAAYRWLRRLASDERDAADPRAWSEWEDIERRLAALAPVLRHVERVQAALRRAQWNPFGPVQAVAQAWRRYRCG